MSPASFVRPQRTGRRPVRFLSFRHLATLAGAGCAGWLLAGCQAVVPPQGPTWQAALMNGPEPGKPVQLYIDPTETLYYYPDSVRAQSPARPANWRVTFYLEPSQPQQVGNKGAAWASMFGEYLLDCEKASREISLLGAVGLSARNGLGQKVVELPPGQPEPAAAPSLKKLFDTVCTRPDALQGIELARKAAREEEARRRAAGMQAAAALSAAQAERERRERVAAEERARRERIALAERAASVDQLLREAESANQRNDTYEACDRSTRAVDSAKGTTREQAAATVRKRLCDRHAQLTEQRMAQARQDEMRRNQKCHGTPRVPRDVMETLGRLGNVNPLSITPTRLERVGTGCAMTLYHPQGVASCVVELDDNGTVRQVSNCR